MALRRGGNADRGAVGGNDPGGGGASQSVPDQLLFLSGCAHALAGREFLLSSSKRTSASSLGSLERAPAASISTRPSSTTNFSGRFS